MPSIGADRLVEAARRERGRVAVGPTDKPWPTGPVRTAQQADERLRREVQNPQLPRVLAPGVNLSKLATYMVAPALVVELQVDYGPGQVLITSAQAALQSDWCG